MLRVLRFARVLVRRTLFSLGALFDKAFTRVARPAVFRKPSQIVYWHFRDRGVLDHVNRALVSRVMQLLGTQPATIIETGSSAWGFDSTRLWATRVSVFGGELWSVDIRPEPREALGNLGEAVFLEVRDSVSFLEDFQERTPTGGVQFAFLDSYDLDLDNPVPSMEHGLKEFNALLPTLEKGSLVLIDDTPRSASGFGNQERKAQEYMEKFGILPGKGALVLKQEAAQGRFEVLGQEYGVLLRRL